MNQIIVSEADISVSSENTIKNFPRIQLPQDFIDWQCKARRHAFSEMINFAAEKVRTMPAHLPVLATYGQGDFSINLTSRGIGLLPKAEFLQEYSESFEEIIQDAQDQPWSETLKRRVQAIQTFYDNPGHIDPTVLGGLEIFEGQTVKNLQNSPLAALLYSGEAPRFASYQFSGLVQFIYPGDPAFRFLLAARELFARDSFHIHQIHYPFGYLFYPLEMRNKTPFPRR